MDHKEHKDTENYISKSKGFFSYVFNTNEDTRVELLNLAQYVTIAFITIAMFMTVLRYYYPTFTEENSSLEIIIVNTLYVLIVIFVLYFINRIICYIPTFSRTQYPHCQNPLYLFPLVLSIICGVTSFNTSITTSCEILWDRLAQLTSYTSSKPVNKKKKQSVSAAPQQQSDQPNIYSAPQMISQPIMQTTPINQLPIVQQPQQQQLSQQEGFTNPEPMAANEGGSLFSAW